MKIPHIVKNEPKKIEINMPSYVREIIEQTARFVIGVIMGGTVILGDLSPFGIALCACTSPKYLISAFAGTFLGSFMSSAVTAPYRYIGAAACAAVLSFVLRSFLGEKKKSALMPGLIALLCCMATAVALVAAGGFSFNELFRYFGESVISSGSAYFMFKTRTFARGEVKIKGMSPSQLSCCAITVSILFIFITSQQIGSFSPGRVLVVLIVLAAGRYIGVAGGAVAGIIFGLSAGMGGDMLFLVGAYACGGLFAGLFAPYGQFASACALTASCCGILVLSGAESELPVLMCETAIGCVLLILMPVKWGNKIDSFINSKIDVSPVNSLRNSLVVKLRFASGAVNGLSQSVESATKKLEEINAPRINDIGKNVCRELCSGCNLKELCWKKEGAKTLNAFNKLYPVTSRDGALGEKNLPVDLEERCIKCKELMDEYNRQYRLFCTREYYYTQLSSLRQIMAEQFYGISDMLMDLSNEFEEAEKYDVELSEQVKRIFVSFGIVPNDVCCIIDKYGRMRIEAHCPQPVRTVNNRRLHDELCRACGRAFDGVNVTFAGHEALVSFCQRANFTLAYATAQHACSESGLCGDCVETVNDGKGREILIISDGMGNGGRAAVDGAMASGLLARLIKAGFSFDCSLRVVNSALQVKSEDETLATLDIVCFDLFTGKTEFYKAGASSSFVKKDGKVVKVELPSLPAGILREVEFAKTACMLTKDDKIVLFTDGVADSDTEWLRRRLEDDFSEDPSALAHSILQQARALRKGGKEDDMTVVVAQIR